ncbi:MAG: hypothetical protein WD119_00205 [Pirellulaceae bacterium]
MNEEKLSSGSFAIFLYTLAAALITGALLFLNGGLVMALLNAASPEGPKWFRDPRFVQFTLFCAPVILVIIEWMMIDFVRSHLWRSR